MARASALWWVGLLVACTPATTHKIVTAADLADPARTRITASLQAPLREGAKTEETPSTVKPDVVADEALIKKLTASEVCFDLVIRTALAIDAPLASWRVEVNGQAGQLGPETVTVRDYPATGEPVTLVSGLTQEAFAARRIGEPKEIAFRVVERRASGCFPRVAAAKRVTLALTLPASDGKGDWGLAFQWHLDGR
jgi:hypothetical protein